MNTKSPVSVYMSKGEDMAVKVLAFSVQNSCLSQVDAWPEATRHQKVSLSFCTVRRSEEFTGNEVSVVRGCHRF